MKSLTRKTLSSNSSMSFKKVFFLFIFFQFSLSLFSQIKLCSWNLENFGKSKSDSAIDFIANTLKPFDVVAIVEVVAGNGGAQAVARLVDVLDQKGFDWDYCISDPTSGSTNSSERYAFLWKTSRLKKLGRAWLDSCYQSEIEREPYFADFIFEGKIFTAGAFHAVPKNKQPETEIKYFKFLPEKYPTKTFIFSGDFNCPESHTVFNPLKGLLYKPIFTNQKTSLKRECVSDECLASEYDNIFYNSTKIKFSKSGVIHFYKSFTSLQSARTVSDHLPVYFEFFLN
ncbi:endonuclease/exonuclease/phosphatase family protein [Aurantibacillus circumpalustris]|uniref:endonuclease/exonuclease/phosphatase family protein n=1 Tax=Aurantibacillus circumpalustris TaxID=3036359 RepID=UPI00295A9281|nr:endonuclease/exonuclease/phosphatase family protein [Aurantibacillus circumpalustris]